MKPLLSPAQLARFHHTSHRPMRSVPPQVPRMVLPPRLKLPAWVTHPLIAHVLPPPPPGVGVASINIPWRHTSHRPTLYRPMLWRFKMRRPTIYRPKLYRSTLHRPTLYWPALKRAMLHRPTGAAHFTTCPADYCNASSSHLQRPPVRHHHSL